MLGMYILACAVDVMVDPLGIEMLMALVGVVWVCSCKGTELCLKKCPVLPVSAIVETVMLDEGGPIVWEGSDDSKLVYNGFIVFILFTMVVFCFELVGAPPFHAVVGAAVAGVVVVGSARGGRT